MQAVSKNQVVPSLNSLKSDLKLIEIFKDKCCSQGQVKGPGSGCHDCKSPKK